MAICGDCRYFRENGLCFLDIKEKAYFQSPCYQFADRKVKPEEDKPNE